MPYREYHLCNSKRVENVMCYSIWVIKYHIPHLMVLLQCWLAILKQIKDVDLNLQQQQLAIFYPRWCNSNVVNRELIHHHYHSENHSVAIRTNFTTLWVINRVAIRWSGFQKIIYQIPLSEGGVCMKHENVPFSLNQRTKLLIISINMKLILY